MTSEQKANELIDKYLWQQRKLQTLASRNYAIECSIINVEEIIQALKTTVGHMTYNNNDYFEVQKDFNYWQSIKQVLTDKLK